MTDYASSGVHFDEAAAAKRRIAMAARTTFGPRVLTDLGHFGGLFALSDSPQAEVLVASTDGVGTKLLLGVQLGLCGGLGRDLVHHCINDILMCGAVPLFFLDYMAFGRLDPDLAAELAESLTSACRDHGVALIGGETAEMPGLYAPGHFDLAGTIVGSVRRDHVLDGSRVREGDVLLGLPSNGLHTNGYSLARRVFAREISDGTLKSTRLSDGRSLSEALLEPHRCYLPALRPLLENPALRALAHITGGGLEENTLRVIPSPLRLEINWKSWKRPEIFRLIQEKGGVEEDEMRRVFNLGIGVVAVVDRPHTDEIAAGLRAGGEQVTLIGRVTA
jgi:phosphoribosylformylglycinamidine cyclo-ligase